MTAQNPYQSPSAYNAHDDEIEYEYVGFWFRVLVSLVDGLIVGIGVFAVGMILGLMGLFDSNGSNTSIELSIQLLTAVFFVFCWVKYAGTPAKRLFGLKILDADTGKHLSTGRAILRYIGYIPATLCLCLGLIWVAFDKRKQGWHDKLANSVVVKEIR